MAMLTFRIFVVLSICTALANAHFVEIIGNTIAISNTAIQFYRCYHDLKEDYNLVLKSRNQNLENAQDRKLGQILQDTGKLAAKGMELAAAANNYYNLCNNFYSNWNSKEACNSDWIHQDPDHVKKALNNKWRQRVFGQDLALKVIRNSLLDHLKRAAAGKSNKPLVLSFHGEPGTGKTFVADLLTNLLFKKGENSSFIRRLRLKTILNNIHTKDEKRHIIENQIKTTVQSCGQSLIILDEIDKVEEGVIDVLFPYFDQQNNIYGDVDFRKAIFIFSSNTGDREISDEACKQFNLTKQRNQFDVEQFYSIIKQASIKGQSDPLSLSRGGFADSKLVKHDLITSFVPFLPLEPEHVMQCMEASFAERDDIVKEAKSKPRLKEDFFHEISGKISYHRPAGCSKSFSIHGCKRVSDIIEQEADSPDDVKNTPYSESRQVFGQADGLVGSGITGAAIGVSNNWNSKEACNSDWIHQDPDHVKKALNNKWRQRVFGQDLALKVIRNSLLDHLKRAAAGKSNKPLVLSFHGEPGTGKTFVADLLTNLLFKKGENSSFVRRLHLLNEVHKVHTKDEKRHIIENQIKTTVQSCGQSLIIFEEIDVLEEGVIDVLFSYFDQQKSVGGVDFRKAIFIFSSNTGDREISDEACKQFNLTKQRSQFDAEQFYRIIKHASYQGQSDPLSLSRGGFAMSKLIKHDLINSFVPFLPLEKDHIVQCMEASFAERDDIVEKAKSKPRLKEDFFLEISGKISYHRPAGCLKTFSENGCKRVSSIVAQEADSFFYCRD